MTWKNSSYGVHSIGIFSSRHWHHRVASIVHWVSGSSLWSVTFPAITVTDLWPFVGSIKHKRTVKGLVSLLRLTTPFKYKYLSSWLLTYPWVDENKVSDSSSSQEERKYLQYYLSGKHTFHKGHERSTFFYYELLTDVYPRYSRIIT